MDRETPEDDRSRTASNARGAIDAGATGDKIAGFDPATAPMETDAEAGGALTSASAGGARVGTTGHSANAASHGSAMRPLSGGAQQRSGHLWPVVVLLALVAIAAFLFISIGWRAS